MPLKPESSRAAEPTGLRLAIFAGIVLTVVGLLAARLVQMQLLDRETYAEEAAGNSVKTRLVNPARGYVYDRNGTLLVDNRTTYDISVTPRYFDETKLPLLARALMMPDSLVQRKYAEAKAYSPYRTSVIFKEVPFEAFARLREEDWRLPGVGFVESQKRRYHSPARLAHILGYVKEISPRDLDRMRPQGYRLGDIVGQAGIEREYESVLRGRVGREFYLANVHGMPVGPFQGGRNDVSPESGYALRLTIDAKSQALAESLMVNMRGGAVMIDVRDGGIIAMASAPDYDPAGFAGRMSQDFVDYVWRNPAKPLFNRATQMYQPPGSTWKPFMALWALQEGMITETTQLYCGGGYVLGRLFKCHGGSHGNIAVKDAIRVSCNTFFFRLMNDRLLGGKRMDLDMFSGWARRFGFGTLAPLDFPDQSPGLIPDSSDFDRWFPLGWGPGYTVNLGIGQGNMGTTPLQLARGTAAIANGGTLVAPHLVLEQVDPATGRVVKPATPRARPIPIDPKNWEIVQRGMELVVEAGTARRAQIEGIGVAGKTGTSQNPHGKDHSVFIAYAPVDDPQVAVGVIIENAGYGSTAAAPIATLLMEQYLTGKVSRPEMVAATRSVRSAAIETP